jgi:5-methylcytosine-specific restriction protein A
MKRSNKNKDVGGTGPAKIGGFEPKVTPRTLIKIGDDWFASDETTSVRIPEELPAPGLYTEGASKSITVNAYERNSKARDACLSHYGYACQVCDFTFESIYGEIGRRYIHVHHVVPLHEIGKEYTLDPVKDLVPICPNCHAMLHKTEPPLTVAALKKQMQTVRT